MSWNESQSLGSNYPQLTQHEWDNAPWNRGDPEEKEFDCVAIISLEKKVSLTTTDYIEEEDYEDGCCHCSYDNSNVDWNKEYREQVIEVPELIGELKKRLTKEIESLEQLTDEISYKGIFRDIRRLKILSEACDGWEVTEITVEEQ